MLLLPPPKTDSDEQSDDRTDCDAANVLLCLLPFGELCFDLDGDSHRVGAASVDGVHLCGGAVSPPPSVDVDGIPFAVYYYRVADDDGVGAPSVYLHGVRPHRGYWDILRCGAAKAHDGEHQDYTPAYNEAIVSISFVVHLFQRLDKMSGNSVIRNHRSKCQKIAYEI